MKHNLLLKNIFLKLFFNLKPSESPINCNNLRQIDIETNSSKCFLWESKERSNNVLVCFGVHFV